MGDTTSSSRSLGRALRAVLNPNHYLALSRIGAYRHPVEDFFRRYVMTKGEYPHVCEMNTPSGPIGIHVRSAFDMFTVAEIYSWRCYPIRGDETVIVDFGANIGISMGYFLAHAPASYVYGFEPLSSNIQTAKANLQTFEGRYTLDQRAVWDHTGVLEFGVEPTGRYSGVGVAEALDQISAPCVRAREAIDAILSKHSAISLLKIDIEGAEEQTLNDIKDEQLRSIRVILVEGEKTPIDRLKKLGMRAEVLPSGIIRFTWPMADQL